MKLPKRAPTHLAETESWRLLQSLAPKTWIVREVSERDYGIDCYVEITKNELITGQLMSIQIKSTKRIDWKVGETVTEAKTPSIKVETASYWLQLPVPVLLLVADLTEKQIYYAPVKDGIRNQYGKLSTQSTIQFRLLRELNLGSDIGAALIGWFYARDAHHDRFVDHVVTLLSSADVFAEFISMNQNRDRFMEVEVDAHLQFRAVYEACRVVSSYLEKDWPIESLPELYAKDRTQWKDNYAWLHEQTLDYALQKLEKIFPNLIRKALKLVTETQAAYWSSRDPVFFSLCQNYGLPYRIQQLEQNAKG